VPGEHRAGPARSGGLWSRERERRESLILCGGGDIPLSGEVSEEGRDLGDTTITRMAEALGRFKRSGCTVRSRRGRVSRFAGRSDGGRQRVADLIEEFHGSPS
jgi:hypothetical protein